MEAVGLESENIEAEGPDTDGPGGPNTQQDGNFDGNYYVAYPINKRDLEAVFPSRSRLFMGCTKDKICN